ncbi:type II toxin-antitoxin system VapC family toxin [Singulisphaera rosea]
MKLVVDAAVGLKWVLPEPGSESAHRLRAEVRNGVYELIAPECFTLEVAHALTKAERQRRIHNAEKLWLDVMTTCPHLDPLSPLLLRAIEISRKARIGVHDRLYVALAEQECCELLTTDDKLIKNLQHAFPFIKQLFSFPYWNSNKSSTLVITVSTSATL